MPQNQLISGFRYVLRGAGLLTHPKLRAFILVPLAINFLLFIAVTAILFQQFDSAVTWVMDYLPSWLSFLAWILWLLLALVILIAYGFSFSIITNIIAAPFYGLLAEQVQKLETGVAPKSEPLAQMVARTVLREVKKLWYFMTRMIGIMLIVFVLSFIPLLNLLVPLIGIIWGAWTMAVQYTDYAADNNKLPFEQLRNRLGRKRFSTYGFGGIVMLGTMVPLLNIFIMPAAVVGGTLYWLNELSDQ